MTAGKRENRANRREAYWKPGSTRHLRTMIDGCLGRMKTSAMPLETTEDTLKERGLRLTRQRQILLELIDKTGEHLDAERLFQMAKEKDPKLNRVTVYRTLKT